MKGLAKLRRFAAKHGASIVEVPDVVPLCHKTESLCPFDIFAAVDWERRRVLFERGAGIYTLTHELWHVLACNVLPICLLGEEGCLGWDYLMCTRVLGLPFGGWVDANRDFYIDSSRALSELKADDMPGFIAEEIAMSIRLGMVTPDLWPTSVRGAA
jgi:hypothetical protein